MLAPWQVRPGDLHGSAQWRGFVAADAHKYKIGQSVRYNAGVARRFGSSASFKIVRLLPLEDGYRQYRIKSAGEVHERIAKENELNLDF
jgi:hypothetical protein